jgi:hypothetical protein
MSLSEIFDHGAPHPWANLRINNLSIDGSISNNTQVGTLSIQFSGPFTTTNFTIGYAKLGRLVVLNLPPIQLSSGGVASIITAPANSIPSFLIPEFEPGSNTLDYPIRVIDNAPQSLPGLFQIIIDGSILINKLLAGASFGVVNTRGSYPISYSYKSAT